MRPLRRARLATMLVCVVLIIEGFFGRGASATLLEPRIGDPGQVAAAVVPAAQVPVVLVHGLRGSGPSTWGAPHNEGGSDSGMYRALRRKGYIPGKTLFVCDYRADNLGDYREIARQALPPAIDLAKRRSGHDRVDVVARSMGGLVARAYVSSSGYRQDVRNLVLIAVPNRGSFGANILKAVEMVSLQQQLRHRGPGRRRVLDKPVLPIATELIPAFEDEVSYIARQSQEVWEPLFGHYYTSAWLLAERSGGGRAEPAGFYDWLRENFNGLYQALIIRAQFPPVRPSYITSIPGGFTPAVPGPGESLSRSFYELLAIQAARHNYFQGLRLDPPEVTAPPPRGGLIERAVAWLVRMVQERTGRMVRQRGQALAMWAMEHLAGIDPKASAADCLIEERAALSVGGPLLAQVQGGGPGLNTVSLPGHAPPGGPDVTANYYLSAWNKWDAERRAAMRHFALGSEGLPPDVRVIHIAGRIPNLWSGLWPDVGPNDLIVETASTFLPLEDNDAYHLLPSLVTSNHAWLGGGGRSWRALVSALRDYYAIRASYKPRYMPGRSRMVKYVRRGRGRAEVYKPFYLELKLPAAGLTGVSLAYDPAAAGPGTAAPVGLRAWAYLDRPGQRLVRYPLDFTPGANGKLVAAASLPAPTAPGGRLLVGVRVEAGAGAPGGPPANRKVGFGWELSFDPREVSPLIPPAGPGSSWAGSGELGAVPKTSLGSQQPDRAGGPQPRAPRLQPGLLERQAAGGADRPVIRATHRDKHTVHLDPVHKSHYRWEWDFGDGGRWVDRDPGRTVSTAEHAYRRPGVYSVVARSLTADGEELAQWSWEVVVEPGQVGWPRPFTAATVEAPAVSLVLDGPVAWVTGRPADYRLQYEIQPRAGSATKAELAYLYPAPEFQMIWERPGEFTVTGALALRLVYSDGTGTRSVVNVYTVSQRVQVYATVVTD